MRSGKPCITGTRVTVQDLLEYLGGGMAEAGILRDLPYVGHEATVARLQQAAKKEDVPTAGSRNTAAHLAS